MELADVIMNSARQRIIQFLVAHEQGTVNQMAEALEGIPRPSLYRHMRVLSEANIIEVAVSRSVRGAVEKTYRLKPGDTWSAFEQAGIPMLINSSILAIAASFTNYFADDQSDPVADMLSVSTSTLMLSDAEFAELFSQIGGLVEKQICNEPRADRKPRQLTLISSPSLSEEK